MADQQAETSQITTSAPGATAVPAAMQNSAPSVQMSVSAAAAIQSNSQLAFTEFESNDWKMYWSSYPMSNSSEMEAAQDKVATMGLPEVFYGNNHLYLARPDCNFLLEISAVDAISFASYSKRQACLRDPANASHASVQIDASGDEQTLNMIDVIPKSVKVREAAVWQNKDTSKITDFSEVEVISDWTFSTPYKASVGFLSKQIQKIKNQTALQIPNAAANPTSTPSIKVEITDEEIPFHKLGADNPIVHTGQIYLFECDLEDSGYTMSQCRFRVMNDSWYVLLRSYVRVDGVTVRILDTRLFHDFTTRYILREFTHREASFDELRQAGFNLSSEWMLSQTQADEVAPSTPIRTKVNDRIIF